MTPECYKGVVIRIFIPIVLIVSSPSVVKARFESSSRWSERSEVTGGHDHAKVPKLHALFFAVAENVAWCLVSTLIALYSFWAYLTAVSFAVNIGQSFDMTHEGSSCSAITHTPGIPDFEGRIIGSGV